MRICQGHIETKGKKVIFGALILLLVVLGAAYRIQFSVSIFTEIFRTCIWSALALGAALIVHAIGLEKTAQRHPVAAGLSLLLVVLLAWLLSDSPTGKGKNDIILLMGLTVMFAVFSYCNIEQTRLRYTICLLLTATALTALLVFLFPDAPYLFFPAMALLLFIRIHETLAFSRPQKRKIYDLSAGWMLLLLCVVSAVLLHKNSFQFTALLAPMNDPEGAGFIPTTIQSFLSGINALGAADNPNAYEFVISLSSRGNYALLILALKFGWLPAAIISVLYVFFLISAGFLCRGKHGLDRTLTCTIPVVGGTFLVFSSLNASGHGVFFAPLPLFSNAIGTISMLFLCFMALLTPNEKDVTMEHFEENEINALPPTTVTLTVLDAPSGAGKTQTLKRMIKAISDNGHHYTGIYLTSENASEAIVQSGIQDGTFDPEAVVEWLLQGRGRVKLVTIDDVDICLSGRTTTQKRAAEIIIYLLSSPGIDVAIAGIDLDQRAPVLMRKLNKYCRKNNWVNLVKHTDIPLRKSVEESQHVGDAQG